MDLVTLLTVVGVLVAIVAVLLQYGSLRLQRQAGKGSPGQKVDPGKAARALTTVHEDPVRAIAADHIFVAPGKRRVGHFVDHSIGVYLDLHSAVCNPAERNVLASSLADRILREPAHTPPGFLIATPREGNVLLGAAVAELLGAKFLAVRTGRAPRFGYPIEGSFTPGGFVVLIDDISIEGTFFGKCVESLRHYGLNVSHCFCLFERIDGDAREALNAISVELHAQFQIDDDQLIQLKFPERTG